MCGICCALGWSTEAEGSTDSKNKKNAKRQRWYHDEVIKRARRLRHRGPDWSGCHADEHCVLGHERLAIVGVDSGAQPLYSTDGDQILAVNGEIYNEKLLKKESEIQGYAFKTHSDCEVLLPLYRTHKHRLSAFLNKLNGIFAFVLVDKNFDPSSPADAKRVDETKAESGAGEEQIRTGPVEKKTGVTRWIAARDHLGIVPLYIGRDRRGAWWLASELKAIWDVCVSFEEFPPGHWFDSLTGKFEQWYAPSWFNVPKSLGGPQLDTDFLTEKEESPGPSRLLESPGLSRLCEDSPGLSRLREELENAVKRQMMCDVPYGALLSGGLDSSIIASIAARLCKKRIEDDSGKEGAHWPVLHTFCVGLEGSPDLAAADEMAVFLKERYGTIHHRIVFTLEEGLAAVEGTVYHLETSNVTTIRAGTPMQLMARRIKTLGIKMVLSGEGADEIFGGYLYFHKAPNALELQKELVSKVRGLSKFDCLRANKAMAAWGVEARVPFLDREFLDYAMALSPVHKLCGRAVGGRIEKAILREAFRGDLPDSIRLRQKEQFSDGCGYNWIDTLKKHAASVVSDQELRLAKRTFPYDTPLTKEGYMIRRMFAHHFPGDSAAKTVPEGPSVACSTAAALAWDASFRDFADCSGRSIKGVHVAEYSEAQRALA